MTLTPRNYLDRALATLQRLGLAPEPGAAAEAPIVGLLARITHLDQDRVIAITRTLAQATVFNDVVRQQVAGMEVGERYARLAQDFDGIRDDARRLVDQLADGRIDARERLVNIWMKATRGDIAQRFDRIKGTYQEVTRAANEQIGRENTILEAYQDFRGALKQAEVLAFEVLARAEASLEAGRAAVTAASSEVETVTEATAAADRARLELTRDERLRELQRLDAEYQIAKDLADNLTIGYHTSEVVMARLMQSHTAKERLHAQAVSFFATNETVLTALSATFTGLSGLHEIGATLDTMKQGVERSLETLADLGGKVQENAVRSGYGPTIASAAVVALVESVVTYQQRSLEIAAEMRVAATRNAEEIREAVEDGKRRLAALARSAAA